MTHPIDRPLGFPAFPRSTDPSWLARQARRALLPIAIIAVLACPTSAQQSCSSLADIAEAALDPGVGGPALVTQMLNSVAGGAGALSASFDEIAAGRFLGHRLRRPRTCMNRRERAATPGRFACTYAAADDPRITVEIDMREGDIDYINPTRRFDRNGPDNQVAPAAAIATAVETLTALGVPAPEIAQDLAMTRNRILVSNTRPENSPKQVRRTEVYVTIPRRVGGFLVHDSESMVAISTAGQPARAHLTWPDFSLGADPAGARVLNRDEIVARIVEAIGAFAPCGWTGAVLAKEGWIEGTVGQDGPDQGRYIPGLRLAVSPRLDRPTPGPTGFVHFLDIPLVTASAIDN